MGFPYGADEYAAYMTAWLELHNLKGIRTKGDEIFGSVGEGGYSLKHGYFKTIFNELKIRFDNKQNIFFLIYIFFGRTLMKIYKSLMFK